MWWLAGAMFLGNAAASIQFYQAGKARALELEERANIKLSQTEEVFQKLKRNRERVDKGAAQLIGQQEAALAKGGIALGTGSSLTIMEDTLSDAESVNLALEEEARILEKRLKIESAQLQKAAEATKSAARTQLLSGLVRGAGAFAGPIARS